MPLYFAYGSNMDCAQMAARCPASAAIGTARLARHRLVTMREGYASVVRDPRRIVWGVLWDLALADIPALDRYERVGGGLYTKRHVAVLSAAGARRALIYVGRNAGPGLPRPGYLETIVEAARAQGLPAGYVAELEALAGSRVTGRLPSGVRPIRRSPLDPEPRPGAWRWTP